MNEFVQADDYDGLFALNFLVTDALEGFESAGEQPEPTDVPVVAKRSDFRPPSVQFERFRAFFP